MLPYRGGFFSHNPLQTLPNAICEELKKEHIYVALANGIRIATCGIPKKQMTGLTRENSILL